MMSTHSSFTPPSKLAFSLVELSIVLVILGLLVGGIIAGQSLIHASELRSVTRDFQKYQTAINGFRDKYFYLPGDIPNATQFWGVAGGDGTGIDAACNIIVSTDATTCNGNGSTIIGDGPYEGYRFWQHLANAGLIEGQYTGTYTSVAPINTPTYYKRGVNMPASTMAKGMFVTQSYASGPNTVKFSTPLSLYNGQHLDFVQELFTSGSGTAGGRVYEGLLSHEDAWNLDTKMDDGISTSGRIRGDLVKNGGQVLTDMTCTAYDLTNTTNKCALGYIFGQM